MIFILTLSFFNIGGVIVRWIETGYISTESMRAVNLIMLSLYSVVFSYTFFIMIPKIEGLIFNHDGNRQGVHKSDSFWTFGNVTFILSIITGICSALLGVEKVVFVSQHGYLAYYSSFDTRFPFVARFATLFELVFWVYAFREGEDRKKKFFTWSLYFVGLILDFALGQRGPMILGLLMIMLYLFKFTALKSGRGGLEALKKRFAVLFIIIMIMLPAISYFLSAYAYIRVGRELPNTSMSYVIRDLIVSQGDSGFFHVNFAVNEYESKPKPQGISYLLAPVVNRLRNGLIGIAMGTYKSFGQDYESAWSSGYWSYYVSYVTLGSGFLEGYGSGSSYIAEAYADMRIFGVIIVNVLYGLILASFTNSRTKNPVFNGLMFYILGEIYYAPRSLALSFLSKPLAPQVFLTIVFLSIFYNLDEGKQVL